MQPSEIARRRRALHAGLRQVLPEAEARDAVEFWTREYARAPGLSLHGFVRALLERYPIRRSHHDVHALLWKSLVETARAEGYEPAPGPAPVGGGDVGRAVAPPAHAPMHRVALVVFLDFIEQVERQPGDGLRFSLQAVRALLADTPVSPYRQALAEAIRVGDRERGLPPSCDAASLSRALSRIYAQACEAVGAVLADRLLSAAVARAAERPEALEFPPARLL